METKVKCSYSWQAEGLRDWRVGQFKRTWTEASLDSSPTLLEVEGFYQSPGLHYVQYVHHTLPISIMYHTGSVFSLCYLWVMVRLKLA